MPEAELNPSASELNQNGSLTARFELWELARKADRQAEGHHRCRASVRRPQCVPLGLSVFEEPHVRVAPIVRDQTAELIHRNEL
jgi:hypothetical protein